MIPDEASLAIAASIAVATKAPFELLDVEPVAGGSRQTALKLAGRTRAARTQFFAKVGEADLEPQFAAEAQGLLALRQAGAVRVPGVVAQGKDSERAWIALSWHELQPLDAVSGALLGAALAAQHRVRQARFGWASDNFIGASVQRNGWRDDWLAFWIERRLVAQLRLAAGNRLPSRLIDRGERLAADCAAFFGSHFPVPSLLHGDLWSGNARAGADGVPIAFDPAVYVGDREADLAMTELFGGFPPDFHSAYRAAWALDDGYRVRRDFYNVYHRLNHANLFFGDHVRSSEHAIERLLAEIR